MRRATFWMVAFGGICVLLACAGMSLPVELIFYAVAGWAFFWPASFQEVSINWPDTLLALGALALFTVGAALVRWMALSSDGSRSGLNTADSHEPRRNSPHRWRLDGRCRSSRSSSPCSSPAFRWSA